ncbi:hypothetical protein MIND_00061000 [Mycena indigotica]|uniref:U2 snRNP-associated SURP motif-containing protein n=1 Tax=Mycena indigotica TaxID=2126181 RepID=A0A8H6TEX5_9AGAR|nr:uncharacterized protein MIND_00061000 [Mycena indigotica]KAF7315461.1 hypothetical protein MIND_00061000 [Mycena indigotica]
MDKTKAKLATSNLSAFFDNDDDESSFSQKTVDDAKLSQYTAGTVRKSRRDKEQEEARKKKSEEEADNAKAYAEFLDAFDANPSSTSRVSAFVKADSRSAYVPSASRDYAESSSRGRRRSLSPVSAAAAPRPKGKRAMDAFLEEIKRDQAAREEKYSRHASGHGRSVTAMAAYDGQSGSKDRGDPQTTNLFVANLPTHVTEPSLGMFFARCGPVGSVKIMWPRTDISSGPGSDMTQSRRVKSTGLSGFVSFMKRKDAEEALRELDGFEWGGSVLRVGWSKAVPIGSKALYVSELPKISESSRHRSRSRSRSRSPRDKHRSHTSRRSRSRSASPPRRHSPSRERRREVSRSPSPLRDEEEFVTDAFIRSVANEVKGRGSKYEQNLKERERNNPKFAFLLRRDHRRHAFYRGLIESNRTLEPEFDDDGYNSVYSTDSAEDSEREKGRKNALGKLARKRFESMLRALSGKRGEMARCMAFCLEHAEAAPEVAELIITSLLVDATPVPRKVARLHLICDILHNSAASVPSAWKFRQEFQTRLGVAFDHMANIYHSFPGRITADIFKKQITSVVDIWEDWIVFPPDFTTELRERLDGVSAEENKTTVTEPVPAAPADTGNAPSRFKSSTFKLATDEGPVLEPDVDGEPMDDDIDGVPLEDDIDGTPLDDIDGVPLDNDDLDGAPIIDDDLDGVPMDDEDLDGEPMQL